MNRWLTRDGLRIFLLAFTVRLFAVAVTTLTSANSYSQADADGFAASAGSIAAAVASGSLPELDASNIYHVWGAMLSPFWLLPGPSRVYARVGMALLGAVAAYNVYVIARHHHSRRAGVFAALPLVFFPSLLFVHATVLREALVLFGLTTMARLLLAPSPRLGPVQTYASVGLLLLVTTQLREENLPVYLLVFALAAVIATEPWNRYPATTSVVTWSGSVVGLLGAVAYGGRILDDLARLRRWRARGRTEYLGWVLPETVPTALAFSWIGAMYFLFSPFPWMVTRPVDAVVMVEGFVNFVYAAAAVLGVGQLARETVAGTVALAVGIVLGSVLYGFATANVGTAVRHRPMALWAIFLVGGIGLAHYLRFKQGEQPS